MANITVSNTDLAKRLAQQTRGDCKQCVCEDSCSGSGKCEHEIYDWLKGAK